MRKRAKKTRIAAVLAIAILIQMVFSGCSGQQNTSSKEQTNELRSEDSTPLVTTPVEYEAYTEEEIMWFFNGGYTDSENASSLTDTQRNSINMLNYLTVLTQEISSSQSSKLYLEQAYSVLINNTYPNAVDSRTLSELNDLLDILERYRMIEVKRDRLEYIYEHNQAQAIRSAVPNPIGMLSAVKSNNKAQLAGAIVYMAVDAVSSYQSSMSESELEYLQDGWTLDEEQATVLHNSRKSAFNYMIDMVNENNLPGDLALNESSVDDFIKWSNTSNVVQRIQLLEDSQDTYSAYGPYWLKLAESYYENGQYSKCLASVAVYDSVHSRIFRKDYDYANTLPLAIVSASETLSDENYVTVASSYADGIIENTDNDDWALRYFAAQTYIELYARTNDISYLRKAYEATLTNVTNLVDDQRNLNAVFLADVEEAKPDTDATKEVKKEFENYNKLLKKERETALPPVSEPLLLNCELLFALADEMHVSEGERVTIDGILHENNSALFLTEQLDEMFRFDSKVVDPSDIDISFTGSEIIIPARYVSENTSISVQIQDGNNGTSEIHDWATTSVDRNKSNDIKDFVAEFKSDKSKDYEYSNGTEVMIEISMGSESNAQVLVFTFEGIAGASFGPFGGSITFERA